MSQLRSGQLFMLNFLIKSSNSKFNACPNPLGLRVPYKNKVVAKQHE